MTATGDCYESAGRHIMDLWVFGRSTTAQLCHAEICPVCGLLEGVTYGHAWVEIDGIVHDRSMGRDIQMDPIAYYAIGGISEVTRYAPEEACEYMRDSRHYGPWLDTKAATPSPLGSS